MKQLSAFIRSYFTVQNTILLAVISIVFIFVTLPFAHDGFFQIMDDVHVVRIDVMMQELRSGQFPVRYVDILGNQHAGYMLFNFYPPFVYYLGALIHGLGFTFVKTVKLLFLLAYCLSTVGIFVLLRKYCDKITSLFGTLLLLTATYFAFNTYIRGGLGEFFALALFPWILWLFLLIREKPTRLHIVALGIIYGVAITSHSATALAVTGVLFLLALIHPSKKTMVQSIGGLLLGLGLSAFFWLPVFGEQQYTMYSKSYFATTSYIGNFLNPLQVAGTQPITWPFKPPFLGIGLFAGVIITTIIFISKRKKTKATTAVFLAAGLAWCIYLFLLWDVSKILYDTFSFLRFLQFPYRFLGIVTVISIILIGLGLAQLKNKWLRIGIGIMLLLPAITLQYDYFRPTTYSYVAEYKAEDGCSSTTWAQEYIPKWVQECLPKKKDIPLVQTMNSDIRVHHVNMENNGRKIQFTTTGNKGEIVIKKYFFPGWEARIDNHQVKTGPYGKHGLIQISVPSGNHSVEVYLTDTPLRFIANMISLVASMLLIIYLLFPVITKNKMSAFKRK